MSCGVGRRRGSDLVLLWLWCRPAAAALIRPLAWEPPCAAGVALKRQKTNRQKNQNLYMNGQSSIIFKSPKLEITQMSIDKV